MRDEKRYSLVRLYYVGAVADWSSILRDRVEAPPCVDSEGQLGLAVGCWVLPNDAGVYVAYRGPCSFICSLGDLSSLLGSWLWIVTPE